MCVCSVVEFSTRKANTHEILFEHMSFCLVMHHARAINIFCYTAASSAFVLVNLLFVYVFTTFWFCNSDNLIAFRMHPDSIYRYENIT